MNLLIACLSLLAVVKGQSPCGCPYRPKSGTPPAPNLPYEPTRLTIVDSSVNSCTITCEKGYKLENSATYAECSNGITWRAQNRTSFRADPLVDNPYFTCQKVTPPPTCAAGTWKTFACQSCDSTKISPVLSTRGECTIMCDRGYRLVTNKGSGAISRLAEATLKGGNWITYAIGSISTSDTATAAAASFSCELIPGNTPRAPTCGCKFDYYLNDSAYEWWQLMATSDGAGSCRVACESGYELVSDGTSGRFASATCTQNEWTAEGKGKLSAVEPRFNCVKKVAECQKCGDNLITITTTGTASASATTDTTGACAVRTVVCTGQPDASIKVNGNGIPITDVGQVTYSVNCNAAGDAWTACGQPVTQLECASRGSCKLCNADLITVTTAGGNARPMTSDTTDLSGDCAVRSFTCVGKNANIELNGGGGTVSGDESVTLSVTCNEEGTEWHFLGFNVSQVECSYSTN